MAIAKGPERFGGVTVKARNDRRALAVKIAPYLRGRVSTQNRWIASFTDAPDVLQFVNSTHAQELAFLGTSCPDHFIRTKIRPLFVPWAESEDLDALKKQITLSLDKYRKQYGEYYHSFATADSPALRDASPTVVLIQGLGMFSFGKSKPKRASRASSTRTRFTYGRRKPAGRRRSHRNAAAGRCGPGPEELQGVFELRGATAG